MRLREEQKDQTIPMDEEEKRQTLVSREMKKKRDVLREALPYYDYWLFLFKKNYTCSKSALSLCSFLLLAYIF